MSEYLLPNENDDTYSNQCRNVVCSIENMERQLFALGNIEGLPLFHKFVYFLIGKLKNILIQKIHSIRRRKNGLVPKVFICFLQ